MSDSSLSSTERSLVTLFVGWAFIFLLFFEGFFITSRIILENRFQNEVFDTTIMRMSEKKERPVLWSLHGPRPQLGIGFIIIDNSGNILENRLIGTEENSEVDELIDKDTLLSISTGGTYSVNGMLMRKMTNPKNEFQYRIFIGKWGYPVEDILRDVLRFLAMDILILLPFWFMGRYFVRQTLKPVEENMDAMAHFINDAGHELKTPLAIISGNLQVLRDSKNRDKEMIETSIKTIDSMADSLDGLLELSRITLPKIKTQMPLRESIEDIIESLRKQIDSKSIILEIQVPKTVKISMDKKHFSILFSNVLENAIRYNRVGGSIFVSYTWGILSIRDTGIGMTEENREKIFDRFFRVDRSGNSPGSGIGLAIVDRIVRLYGWKITVVSELGKGTTFSLVVK